MADITPATLMSIYRTATTIRQCDERFLAMLTAGEIAITYYSPRGQEVISAATAAHLTRDDYVVTIIAGCTTRSPKVCRCRNVGRVPGPATGTCKGKGGPMHITDVASG